MPKSVPGKSTKELRKLRSATQNQAQLSMLAEEEATATATDAVCSAGTPSEDLVKIYDMLAKILEETSDLKEIRRSVTSVDEKLSCLVSRINTVEERVSKLEDEQASMKANPAATQTDIQAMINRLAILEDRARRKNLRFVGIPEGSEKGDMIAFLNNFVATALDLHPPPGGFEMDRAHRIGSRTSADTSRTIIACLLRFQDRQDIVEAARRKKRITWNDKKVMIFPDFSRETQKLRETFVECKRAMHERNIKFGMLYPARLKIFLPGNNSRIFEDSKQAMDYVKNMGGK
ncbi:hypothetical protein WMY93_010014 [Mugilogobius chulae]|uniref:L1 transposable element RRM domain-containing protein n=1 Tax=Mugilogobius chulae TaxID=88201 RepID=A0AAW0P7H3_9GOBI